MIGHQTQHKVSEVVVVVVVVVGRMNEKQTEREREREREHKWCALLGCDLNLIDLYDQKLEKKKKNTERESGGALFYFLFGFL